MFTGWLWGGYGMVTGGNGWLWGRYRVVRGWLLDGDGVLNGWLQGGYEVVTGWICVVYGVATSPLRIGYGVVKEGLKGRKGSPWGHQIEVWPRSGPRYPVYHIFIDWSFSGILMWHFKVQHN